jgi:hypothetical protein
MSTLTEGDWKYLSSIRSGLLEELSRRINAEVVTAATRAGVSENDKRHAVYKLVRDRDRDTAAAFDDWRRSQMFFVAMEWRRLGLLTEEHLTHLTPEGARALRKFDNPQNA